MEFSRVLQLFQFHFFVGEIFFKSLALNEFCVNSFTKESFSPGYNHPDLIKVTQSAEYQVRKPDADAIEFSGFFRWLRPESNQRAWILIFFL